MTLPPAGPILFRPYPRIPSSCPPQRRCGGVRFVAYPDSATGDVRAETLRGVTVAGFFLPSGRLRLPDTLFESAERTTVAMHVFGVGLLALGALGLLAMASAIAWDELRTLRYVSRLDEWAEDVPPWQ